MKFSPSPVTVFRLLAAAWALALAAPPSLAALSPSGRVVNVAGNATVKNRALRPGDSVYTGDEIRTKDGSAVKLLMIDRTIVDVGASSIFRVAAYSMAADGTRQVDLALDLGTVRANVSKRVDGKSRFFIRTKSSVMAVRGTEVIAQWQTVNGQVRHQVTVVEGLVAYTPAGGGADGNNGGTVNLGAGRQLNFSDGGPGTGGAGLDGSGFAGGGTGGEGPGGAVGANNAGGGGVAGGPGGPGGAGGTGGSGEPGGPSGGSGGPPGPRPGEGPRITTLTATQMGDVINNNRIGDNTFVSNVIIGDNRGGQGGGQETMRSLALNVERRDNDRKPAGADGGPGPGQAPGPGRNPCNGGCPIPGFNGIPGTNTFGPIAPPIDAQLPVNLTVIFKP